MVSCADAGLDVIQTAIATAVPARATAMPRRKTCHEFMSCIPSVVRPDLNATRQTVDPTTK
jgi:hypothetical protein